jgi:hypothetical protein
LWYHHVCVFLCAAYHNFWSTHDTQDRDQAIGNDSTIIYFNSLTVNFRGKRNIEIWIFHGNEDFNKGNISTIFVYDLEIVFCDISNKYAVFVKVIFVEIW